MSAADVARTLGDARREGSRWRCRCPLHGGRSLSLSDGDRGLVLATCWGDCDRHDVLAELRQLGLLEGRGASYPLHLTKPLTPADAGRTTDRTARVCCSTSSQLRAAASARWERHDGRSCLNVGDGGRCDVVLLRLKEMLR